jgi:uncharacterized protein (TIGR02145 family)
MKKMMNFLSAAATIVLASAFAACSSDALVNEEAPEQEQQKVSLTVKATQGSRTPDTRLAYSDPDNGTIDVKWSTEETLGVVSYIDGLAPTITDEDPTLSGSNTVEDKTMTFSGEATESTGSMVGKYNFYYPTSGVTKSGNTVKMDVALQMVTDLSNPLAELSSYNLMYTEKAVNPSAGITLKHAFALLRFKLTLPEEAGSVSTLYISTWKPVFATSATVTYDAAGDATLTYAGETSMLNLFIMSDTGSGARTVTAYMLVPAVEDFTGQLCKVSLYDNKQNYYSYVYNLTGSTDKTAATGNLTAQKVYTFTATLKPDLWASSNVYWHSGGYGNFDRPNTIGGAAYQGLFYKWGSLVGISPVGEWTPNETPLYNSSLGATYDWANIPYDNVTASGSLPPANDICEQISGGAYRMPTHEEWADFMDDTKTKQETISLSTVTSTNPEYGTDAIYSGTLYDDLVFIPSAGSRNSGNGNLTEVGASSYYWSNTTVNTTFAYQNTSAWYKTEAYPIRCIKK